MLSHTRPGASGAALRPFTQPTNACRTCAGPGTSLQFALKIVEQLYGKEKADFLAAQMLTTLA